MPAVTPVGNVLVLYGFGSVAPGAGFNFQRPHSVRMNLYVWASDGIAIWDRQIQLAADDAVATGTIRDSYAEVLSSRIGGVQVKDYVLQSAPEALIRPNIPAEYAQTRIAALGAAIHHNAPALADSTRMALTISEGKPGVKLSEIITDARFATRPFDILWLGCRTKWQTAHA